MEKLDEGKLNIVNFFGVVRYKIWIIYLYMYINKDIDFCLVFLVFVYFLG